MPEPSAVTPPSLVTTDASSEQPSSSAPTASATKPHPTLVRVMRRA
ncbi:MAG TPA: hypothetical protein VF316_23705 [Polyangiaceae bacterium]